MIAEENQVRQDLQMALDSKDSDIEQLRSQLSTLSVHSMDSTSISSGNDLDATDPYPGRQEGLHVLPVSLLPHLFPRSCCLLRFHFESLYLPGHLFLTFCLHFFLFPISPRLHVTPLLGVGGLLQCALLTPTPLNQCPSPTSAHTNRCASTPDPTSAQPALSSTLTLSPRTRKSWTGRCSRAPGPSPTNSPMRLNPQVTPHGSSVVG